MLLVQHWVWDSNLICKNISWLPLVSLLADFKMVNMAICFRRWNHLFKTHWRARELTPLLLVISTKLSASFHASIFLRTRFHPNCLKVSVTGDSQQFKLYFSHSISITFVRIPVIQKKPTGLLWLNINCSRAQMHWISALKSSCKRITQQKDDRSRWGPADCNMQNACSHFVHYSRLKTGGNKHNTTLASSSLEPLHLNLYLSLADYTFRWPLFLLISVYGQLNNYVVISFQKSNLHISTHLTNKTFLSYRSNWNQCYECKSAFKDYYLLLFDYSHAIYSKSSLYPYSTISKGEVHQVPRISYSRCNAGINLKKRWLWLLVKKDG